MVRESKGFIDKECWQAYNHAESEDPKALSAMKPGEVVSLDDDDDWFWTVAECGACSRSGLQEVAKATFLFP
jgi:hypothetical protein